MIASPVLVGLFHPVILLPHESRMSGADLGMVIHHELVHLKRKDLWVKMLVVVAGAMHWFNPFVHKLRKEIHLWSELSCDEEVVKEMSPAERKHYGLTILNLMEKAAEMPAAFSALLSENGQLLKQRLVRLLHVRRRIKLAPAIISAAVMAAGGLGTAAAVWAADVVPAVQVYAHEESKSAPARPVVQEEHTLGPVNVIMEVIKLMDEKDSSGPLKIINLEDRLEPLDYVKVAIPPFEQSKAAPTR